MVTKDQVESGLDELVDKYGEWTYDIPLPHDVWTRGNRGVPFMRLKRILQAAHDLSTKPLSQCRVLDLACLDGQIAIEFALQDAQTVGIEIREENIKKAEFCKNALGLDNLSFLQDNVRNISSKVHGTFDVIVCSGILYHLTAADAVALIEAMHQMCSRLVIIDTHTAQNAEGEFSHNGVDYSGSIFVEHSEGETQEQKSKKLWSSWDNVESFWFTRSSLVNLIANCGFSTSYECFAPIYFEEDQFNRCTFVAIKNDPVMSITSPSANTASQMFNETDLNYQFKKPRFKDTLRRMIGLHGNRPPNKDG